MIFNLPQAHRLQEVFVRPDSSEGKDSGRQDCYSVGIFQSGKGDMNMAVQEQTQVNGVNVDQLVGTINAIKADPTLARFKFRAETEWIAGGHSRTAIQSFYGAGQEDASRSKPEEQCAAREAGGAVRLRPEDFASAGHRPQPGAGDHRPGELTRR